MQNALQVTIQLTRVTHVSSLTAVQDLKPICLRNGIQMKFTLLTTFKSIEMKYNNNTIA